MNLNPSQNELNEIERWLIDEYQNTKEGFYCNWETIKEAFMEKRLVTLNYQENSIAFLVWSKKEIYTEIDIMEVTPNYRRKGIGRNFVNQFSEYLTNKGFIAIKLFCKPRESEKFWKEMNFKKFPGCIRIARDLTYFKPLIKTHLPATSYNGKTRLELWNVEIYQIKNHKPKWVWTIPNDLKLSKPIIQPCNCNWNLRLTKNGNILKEDKVKNFAKKDEKICYNSFLYIQEITE